VDSAAADLDRLREALLSRAAELGIDTADEDAAIEAVLDREVAAPKATEAECRRHYDAHPERFAEGASVTASHILFAIHPGAPVEAIRRKAEEILAAVRADPASFAARARECSNCPSGAEGGRLGALARGATVPEFEQAIFGPGADGVLPRLVMTRHGFHIVRVEARDAGRMRPFEAVQEGIARHLEAATQRKALAQYAQVVTGSSPLVR
jgi:peptidyl-prolyl cis-trans isomerase C